MKIKSILLSLVVASLALSANDVAKAESSSVLADAMKNGKTSGQIRYYYMSEDNTSPYRDYYGSAIGGHLKYETGAIGGFNVGAAFYASQFLSSDYDETSTEPLIGNGKTKNSRYVAGLMDAEDPSVRNITGIGELYLNYKYSKTNVRLGRMKLNTPFINPVDGRMIPTLTQGLWIKSADLNDFVFQAGFLNAFWNRSTSNWKSAEDSIGYGYPQGNHTADTTPATKAEYAGNTSTDGVYVASASYSGVKGLNLQVWDYYIENIMNVAYAQADYVYKTGDFKYVVAGQYINQVTVGDGGNSDNTKPEYSYRDKGEKTHVFGAKVGVGYSSTMVTLAASKVTDHGRFQFPREWGKEPLFTFQKRERTDGSGDASAVLLTVGQDFGVMGVKGLDILAGIGRYNRTDAKDWSLNKFGIPSYIQGNIDVTYKFDGLFKGLSAEYIFARKVATGETYNNANFIVGKNDMNIHNFIMNYNF